MPRQKRSSRALEKAEFRRLGIQSIDPELDLGNGFSVKAFTGKINTLRQKLETYNLLLSTISAMSSDITEFERELSTYSAKMLSNIGCVFGKNSSEYEKSGGTRQIERQRSTRRLPSEIPEQA